MKEPNVEEVTEFTNNLINSKEFKEFAQRRKNNTYNLITSNVIKKGGVISEDKPLKERIIESNKRIVALINELNKEKEMKYEFIEGKMVVAENYNEIVKILKELEYNIESFNTGSPFIIINKKGEAFGCTNNYNFYDSKIPIITLDTLKQWQRENIELVEGEFYYLECEGSKCIFILDSLQGNQFYSGYSFYIDTKSFFTKDNPKLSISKCSTLRPATPEEIQLLKDKVKEKTGKVFNEDTKMFEEPKKKVEFKPFDRVLGRDNHDFSEWHATTFSHYRGNDKDEPYGLCGGDYEFCIPYEGNEHLLGTTNNPE